MNTIDRLYETILQRKSAPPDQSYTARLFAAGPQEVIKKVGEEAVEVVLAASVQSDERLVSELADLTYHVLALMAMRGITPQAVAEELEGRRK